MRDDLLDAQAAVDWAVTQIPIYQEKLKSWNQRRPYELVEDHDPQTGEQLWLAYSMGSLDPIINAEVGVIINSTRTALDFLAASLARHNPQSSSDDTKFPIFASEQEMIDPLTGIEGKKWLSKREQSAIKALKPYKGGDDTIWPLNQLDNLRKHRRLIETLPELSGLLWQSKDRMIVAGSIGSKPVERVGDKLILRRSAEPVDFAQGDAYITTSVVFNEPKIVPTKCEAARFEPYVSLH
jgi:hypothetical protein